MPPWTASPVPNSGRPPARRGISPRKTVLRGHVPEKGEYFAARAGDSPFSPGTVLPLGATIGKDGTAMYVGLLSVFALQALGVPITPAVAEPLGATYWASLDQMLARVDILSINAPHTPSTFHLLNARRLKLLKPSAVVSSSSRASRCPRREKYSSAASARGFPACAENGSDSPPPAKA